MDTATLLVIVGSVVCVKTLAFVGLIVRRDRRQRRALEAAAALTTEARAAARAASESVRSAPGGWRLQWAEPGVLLVQNASVDGAREVRLSATLTAGCGAMAAVDQRERFVGTGACFAVRFAELEAWLAEEGDLARQGAAERLTCSLGYTLTWLTADGEWSRETRADLPVLPLPDLVLEAA